MKRMMIAFVAAATFAAGMGTTSGAAAATVGAAPDDSVGLTLAGGLQTGELGSASPGEEGFFPSVWGELPFQPRAMATVMADLRPAENRDRYVGLMVDPDGGLWNYSVTLSSFPWISMDTYYSTSVVRAGSGYGGVRDMVAPEPWQYRTGGFKASPYVYLLTTTGLQRAVVTPGLKLYSGKAVAGAYGDIDTLAWGGRRSINGVVKDVLIATTTAGALVEIRVGTSLTDVKRVVLRSTGFAGLSSLGLSYRRSASVKGTYIGITDTGFRKTWQDANVFDGSGRDISAPTRVATNIPRNLVEGYFPYDQFGSPSSFNWFFGWASSGQDPDYLEADGKIPYIVDRVPTIPTAMVQPNGPNTGMFGVTTDGRLVRYEEDGPTAGVAREVVLKTGWTSVRDLVRSQGRYVYVLGTSGMTRWTVSNGTFVSGVKVPGDFSDIAELGYFAPNIPGATHDKLIATTKTGALVQLTVSRTTTPTVARQTWATSGYDGVTAISGAGFGPELPKVSFVTLVKGTEMYRLMNRNTGGTAALVGLGTETEAGRYTGHVDTVTHRYY